MPSLILHWKFQAMNRNANTIGQREYLLESNSFKVVEFEPLLDNDFKIVGYLFRSKIKQLILLLRASLN